MDFKISDLYKIPNILCYIRIILVPVFMYTFLCANEPKDYYLAAGIVLISGITDFLDGQIARRCNMITDLGKMIDPVADKLMQLAMIVCVTFRIQYMLVLVIYLVVKEALCFFTSLYVYKKCNKRINGAKWYGKVCTAVLYAVMLVLIVMPELNNAIQVMLLIVCGCVLTLALVMYMRIYIQMYKDTKNGDTEFRIY